MRRRLLGGEQRGPEEDWGETDTEAGLDLCMTLFLTQVLVTTSWCSVRFGWEGFQRSRTQLCVVCDT